MSTRANIYVEFNGKKVQFYKHHDGYPEGLGVLLSSYYEIAKWSHDGNKYNSITEAIFERFLELLRSNKDFEEENCLLHSDIEYLYFVKFVENQDDEISFIHFDSYNEFNSYKVYTEGQKKIELELKIK